MDSVEMQQTSLWNPGGINS